MGKSTGGGDVAAAVRFVLQPHVLPYVLFLALTQIGGFFEPIGPLVAYPVKLLAVSALLVVFLRRGSYPELGRGNPWAEIL